MKQPVFPGRSYFHGTKADLKVGDLVKAGHDSNYYQGEKSAYVYLTGTLNAAIWGAELAAGESRERIYVVEATGPVEDDPDLTDKKYPGNPTLSYRSAEPLRVIAEVTGWQGHSADELNAMKSGVARQKGQNVAGTVPAPK